MKIKMLVFRQGYFHPEPLHGGREYDLLDSTAQYLIDLGVAVKVDGHKSSSATSAPNTEPVAPEETDRSGSGAMANTGVGRPRAK